MKIKSTLPQFYGKEIKVPVDGKVTLDNEGCFDATEEAAEALLGDGWISCEPIKEDEDVEKESFSDGLKKLSLEELIQVCEEAEFPASEWGKYKKSKTALITYINKKNS
jgi:hypothetical protein